MLGNWAELITDTADTYGVFDGSNTSQDREHNGVNELISIDSSTVEYDHAGNLRHRFILENEVAYRYIHDAWNRLVRVEYVEEFGEGEGEVIEVRGEYEYNGLHQRTVHRLDTNDPPN